MTPTPDWSPTHTFTGAPGSLAWETDMSETIHFSVADGGRVLRLVVDMRAGKELLTQVGPFTVDFWLRFAGEAEGQDGSCSAADPCETATLILAPLLPGGVLPSSHPCFVPAQPEPPGSANSAMAAPRARRLGVLP